MAKLYILTDEQIKSGARPPTPRDKVRHLRKICVVLTLIIMAETALLLKGWM